MKKITILALLSLLAAAPLRADLIWYEGFQYLDGAIITNTIIGPGSNSIWIRISGSANPSDMIVGSSNLQVSATGGTLTRQDDCERLLATTAGSPYTNSVQLIYASFTVICTNLPNGLGSYFASFYRSGSPGGYCGRIQAFTSGSVLPKTWRLGASANVLATNAPDGGYPVDLALNTPYQVVVELDPVSLFAVTVWINPINTAQTGSSPTETHYTTSDGMGYATTTPVAAFAFRQASSFGNSFFQITNLALATTFAEAATNISAAIATPPVIVYQPVGVTNYIAAPISLSAVANGQGLGNMTYVWQQNGTNYPNGNGHNILNIPAAQISDSGDFTLVATTPYGLSVTSAVAKVLITAGTNPPTFTSQPATQKVYRGQSVGFSATVISPGSVTFTWYSNNVVVTDGVNTSGDSSSLQLNNVATNFSATYKVAATNDLNPIGVVSSNAVLTVINPAHVSIAYLRTLVDPLTYLATNTPPTIPYEVTGTVTTYTNITTGDTASYYLQDATAGINIFATFGSTFRPDQGDVVTFVGVVSSYTTGLELYADPTGVFPYTSYTDTGVTNSLPVPISIPYTVLNNPSNANYNLGGSLVQISDAFFGARAGTTTSIAANDYVTVTNSAGQSFSLMFPYVDLDVAGQTLPDHASTVSGILYSAGSVVTNTIVVTRFADINTNASVVPIPLNVGYSAGTLTFNWSDASFSLQSSTNVTGPYTIIPGASSGFTTNTTSAPAMFFRLYHP